MLELLARGSFTQEPTLVSSEYARKLWETMKRLEIVENSGANEGKLNLLTLREMLKSDQLPVAVFEQTHRDDSHLITDV